MVVHEELNSTNISGLLGGLHLPHQVVHPEHQITNHSEEPEEVVGVVQLRLSAITLSLKLEPSAYNFPLAVGDFHGLVASICILKFGRLGLDCLNLAVKSLQVLDEVLMLSLESGD